jgi:hypothetical protein
MSKGIASFTDEPFLLNMLGESNKSKQEDSVDDNEEPESELTSS